MRVRLSIRIPSSSAATLAAKVGGAYARAASAARSKVAALVEGRVSAAAGAIGPGFASRYRAAMRAPGAVEVTDKAVTVTVSDPIVAGMERGAQAYDMKPKLLARGKVAKSGGVYVDIAFRHKPGSVPQAMRTAGRRAARSFGGVGELRMAAKTEGRSFTRMLNRGPAVQAFGLGPARQKVKHKRGVHDDLIRTSTRKSSGAVSVRYTTIRRVSSRSDSSAWWNPGFKARHVIRDALAKSKQDIAAIIRESIASAGGK